VFSGIFGWNWPWMLGFTKMIGPTASAHLLALDQPLQHPLQD
jgi:hypothetical protein